MVALFGGVGLFVLVALAIGAARCARELRTMHERAAARRTRRNERGARRRADAEPPARRRPRLRDGPEVRTPWRRWLHHATFYGFMLCFASTCVATLYHFAGSPAPYAYTSLPVLLGTAGGLGLVVGTAGSLLHRRAPRPRAVGRGAGGARSIVPRAAAADGRDGPAAARAAARARAWACCWSCTWASCSRCS